MGEVSKFNIDGSDISVKDENARASANNAISLCSSLSTTIGELSGLETEDKSSVVNAINSCVSSQVDVSYNEANEVITFS